MKGLFMARILLVVTLVLFGALTSVAVWHHGYRGIFETMFQSWAGVQVLVDLVIALVLVLVWMWRDAQVLKRSVWPYVLITLVAGSFGPLLYLLTRKTPARAGSAKVL
jgi:4-amino-4-deoxy-L-arabinose transferase-like glycosyltransferase